MILTVDIGTTAVKAALFDRRGRCHAYDSRPVDHIVSADPLAHEVYPESWMRALSELVPALLRNTGGAHNTDAHNTGAYNGAQHGARFDCIVVSGNGPTLVPVGRDGEALAPAVTWMDRRAAEEAALASTIVARPLDPAYNLPKALRFKRTRPDIYEITAHFSSCPEYVSAQLTGIWRSVLPAQGFKPIIWDSISLRALGLDEEKFPAFIKLGEILGPVTRGAAKKYGLCEGTPVICGGPDFVASLIGTATTKPGRAADRAGTSEGVNLCHNGDFPEDSRLLVMPHIIEPYRNVSGVISTTGRAVSWFRATHRNAAHTNAQQHAADDRTSFEHFFKEVADTVPGAERLIFLPYLSGERAPLWDTHARGAFIGLTLNHTNAHMARAVVESTALAMRDVISTMESLGGTVHDLRATGHPSTNAAWNQIKADITGKPLLVPEFPHAELLGELCIALTALKEYNNFAEAAESLVKIKHRYLPDHSLRGLYDDLFSMYKDAYKALKPVFFRYF